jgi:gliding motility-associated-like protein
MCNFAILQAINAIQFKKYCFLIPLSIFLFLTIGKVFSQCDPRRDSLILVQLYDSTSGDRWVNTLQNDKKWKVKSSSIGTWYGVTVNTAGCVTALGLDADSLRGQLPDTLRNLSDLVSISIERNRSLTGKIPNFSALNLKEIYLTNNSLTGSIPNFDLPNLEYLKLYHNKLSGSIPNLHLPKLRLIYLYNNDLSGCIPYEIKKNCPKIGVGGELSFNPKLSTQNWTRYWLNNEGACQPIDTDTTACRYKDSLQLVILYDSTGGRNWTNKWQKFEPLILPNNLVNTQYWYGITTNTEGCVTEINLPNNNLGGKIPNLDLAHLTKLDIGYNLFSGNLPNFNLPKLIFLSVWKSGLSGLLPSFTNVPKLKQLYLANNDFQGNLPLWGNLSDIQEIDLGYNKKLTGNIPPFSFPRLTFFSTFDCGFTGLSDFSGCPALVKLTLSLNNLSGVIPDFNLPNLQTLLLNNNQFFGQLPNLNNLDSLNDIQFQNNRLTGCFPISYRRFCTSISDTTKRNFNNNQGLDYNGYFTQFCKSKMVLDTSKQTIIKSIFWGDSIQLKNGDWIKPAKDTVYGETTLTGCVGTYQSIKVNVSKDPKLPFKTAITPNGDNIYDQLDLPQVDWNKFPQNSIEIYNRWGQKVYEAQDYKRDWEGKNTNGAPLEEDEYLFILRSISNGQVILKGSVHVFR